MTLQQVPVQPGTIGTGEGAVRVFIAGELRTKTRAAMVLLPAIHGANDYAAGVAQELAQAGYPTVVIDIHAPGAVPDLSNPPAIRAAVAALDDTKVLASIRTVVEHVKEQTGGQAKVGVLGFCIGGTHALLAASEVAGVGAAVGFYGMLRYAEKTAAKPYAPMDRARDLRAPVLYHVGDNDPWVDAETLRQYTMLLREHGVHHEVGVYPGAGHAFHEHHRPSYRAVAARTSWRNTLAFLDWHLRGERHDPSDSSGAAAGR
jgi:carboxymethylenebutenolidase